MIAIMGASGKTGGGAARHLLEAGEKVRVLGRSAERLGALKAAGAGVAAGDAADAGYLAGAFRGADAAYVLLPPNVTAPDYRALQRATGEAITRAVRESGVPHVVLLSSIGAEQAEGTGPIVGLHELEEQLKAVPGVNVLALRPGYFFENHLGTVGLVKHEGINGSAIAPDLPSATLATTDIARAAASALKARDVSGFVVRELHGPALMTMREATDVIGRAIGKPDLPYVQFAYDDLIRALVGMGLSESMAGLYAEMSQGFNEGRIAPLEPQGPGNTTPTTFEAFVAETYVPAYEAA